VEALILLGSDETFSGPCFTGALSLFLFLSVTIWVTSLGSLCEAAIFTELLFYPNVLGVPKWFTALLPSRAGSRPRMIHVVASLGTSCRSHCRKATDLRLRFDE